MQYVLDNPALTGRLLNVNIPNRPMDDIKGLRVCRQADARWIEDFMKGHDPNGQPYYWLAGKFVNFDEGEDTDIWALENGYVSVVPSMHDLTNYLALPAIKPLETF
jgi:5'-nucleotidase